jgi:magnesium transporter
MLKNDLSRPVKDFAIPVHTTLHQDQTIEEALVSLRQRKIDEKIVYFYVVDDEGRLQGIVPTRQLLLKDPHHKIKEVMGFSVIRVYEDQTLEEAMELFSSHQLLALPVVDKNEHLKGIIDVQVYIEESLDIADSLHNRDVFQILGLNLEMGKRRSPWLSYRVRMPWILCNMGGGIACAVISFFYQAVLAQVLLLAMFIPLILTLSESISMQSMTQSLNLVRQPHVSWRRMFHRVFTEGKMVVLLALTCALTVGVISLFWGGGFGPSITIAVSLFVSITLSASVGASVPILLHARALDPKVASGPVVLMLVDIMTTALYLSLATWWLLT